MRNVDMSTLMLPAATMTTMTNTAPIAVAQPKADPVKGTLLNNNNNKQGREVLKKNLSKTFADKFVNGFSDKRGKESHYCVQKST